ncbi:MAG: TolB family protein, partial [Nitrososphaeraceae archaeon]
MVLAVAISLSVLFVVPSIAYADGSKIAFNSTRDGNYEIYIMNVDGSGQTNLTNNSVGDYYPSFSPDGSQIAFSSDLDGGGDDEIYLMNVDGTGQTRLTNNSTGEYYPSFSPDGSKIAFMTYRDPYWEIYIMNVDGTEEINLTN